MKLLYISHDAQLNGAPKSLLEYVVKIKNKNVDPVVVVPSNGKLRRALNQRGIKTIVVPHKLCVYKEALTLSECVGYIHTNSRAIAQIIKIIRENKIDIVHSNSTAVDIGAIAACLTNTPHIWHIREYLKEDFNYQLLIPVLTKMLIKKSARVIAISKELQRKYEDKYKINVIQLYNGLESSNYYRPLTGAEKMRDPVRRILLAGSISREKGQWDAIRAIKILVTRRKHIELLIAGNGDKAYIAKLRRYVRENNLEDYVKFSSYINNLQEVREKSDIVLVCSQKEAFGRVTAEAMLAGKIVIGTASGGTLELIGRNEERGYLYSHNKPLELANKIEYVLDNPDEVFNKKIKAQQFALKLTNLDRYTDILVKIYKSVLDLV